VELKLQSLQLLMLDWTTSFLSDVFIIKPSSGGCQTLSDLVLGVAFEFYDTTIGVVVRQEATKKTPRSYYGALDENQTK
jgi:hypothetical protein